MRSTTDRSLGSCCEVVMGQAPPGAAYNHEGMGWPLVAGASDFGNARPNPGKFTSEAPRLSKVGDIILGVRATIGVKVLSDREYCLGRGVAALRPGSELDERFLWHWLSAVQPVLASKGRGATFKQVTKRDISELELDLPPLAEQRRIADILDRADDLRAKRQAAIDKLDSLTQAIFHDVFGEFKNGRCPWKMKAVGDLCEVRGGKRLPKGAEYSLTPTHHPYVRVVDLAGGYIRQSGLLYLSDDVHEQIARYIVAPGDVVISIAGTVGLTASVPKELEGANLTENAAKLSPRSDSGYRSQYLTAVLRSRFVQDQIRASVGQVTIGKLALFRIERLVVPVPPLEVQDEFIGLTVELQNSTSLNKQSLTELTCLSVSLQQQAFSGAL